MEYSASISTASAFRVSPGLLSIRTATCRYSGQMRTRWRQDDPCVAQRWLNVSDVGPPLCHPGVIKHETLNQCWAYVGPTASTLAQHWFNVLFAIQEGMTPEAFQKNQLCVTGQKPVTNLEPNAGSMLCRRRRRRHSVDPALGQYIGHGREFAVIRMTSPAVCRGADINHN